MHSASRNTGASALAGLAWFGVLLQCWLSLRLATHNGNSIGSALAAYFSYFTVLTNMAICISLSASRFAPSSALGRWSSRPAFIAGTATSIAFVGLSYHFLLRNTWNPQGAQLLADVLLHYIVPALYVLYWWFNASDAALRWTHPMRWSIYPTAYLIYTLIRGRFIGSYPYPFIDAAALGYARTMQNAIGLLCAFVALGLVFVALSRARQRKRA